MGELDAITRFVKTIVRESIDEAQGDALPKYFEKQDDRTYTVEEVCRILGIKKTAFYDRVKAGLIKPVRKGSSTVIPAAQIDALKADCTASRYTHFRKNR